MSTENDTFENLELGITQNWTKFVCTIGPASDSPEMIEKLVLAGANILRNNFAHAQYDEYRSRKAALDEINDRLGTNTKMQADLQGPNIRIGVLPPEGINLVAGQDCVFYTNIATKQEETDISINDDTLHVDVKAGEPITFCDGAIEGEVSWVEGGRIGVKILSGGLLESKKSVNVPETDLSCDIITEKDKADLAFLLETGVDYIALSFICGTDEIRWVREQIGDRPIKIIAKIERKLAIDNLQPIVEAADAVMIARGDLGIELPMEEIPILQRTITMLCEHYNKPVITATQMLLSMTKNMRPTRAEVSDVANAVFNRSDALMLSEETARGIDPVNALKTMKKIARRVEEYLYHRPNCFGIDD